MVSATVPTRGERNNNPGNIDFQPATDWIGQIGIELQRVGEMPRFVRFDTAEHGIRAVAKILLHYERAEHRDTISEIVARWAPAIENATAAYIADVDRQLGVGPDDPVDIEQHARLAATVTAIIHHENGRCLYDAALIDAAARDALGMPAAPAAA